jgi:HTH-type transcriptional regulator/antitoxin HigA
LWITIDWIGNMRHDNSLIPAHVTPPGDSIQEELTARRWTQRDLAKKMRRPVQAVNEIIRAKRQITAETALELGEVFGTSAEMWIGMEGRYRLHLARQARQRKSA